MARYLSEIQLKTNLRLGKSVEQWLSANDVEDYTIIKWLTIEKEKDGMYNLFYIESFDEGDENFIDVIEFSAIDADEPYSISKFASQEEALDFSIKNYGALVDKFVTQGMIQEEYLDYLKARK